MAHKHHQLSLGKDTIKLLQITDTHLFADKKEQLLGVPSYTTFLDVLAHTKKHHPDCDLHFFTGDIAQHGSEGAYEVFLEQASLLQQPYFCLAGNHDDPAVMGQFFEGSEYHQIVTTDHWHFFMMNSYIQDSPAGAFTEASLHWLHENLSKYQDKPTMLWFHHHPVPMQSEWIDQHCLKDSDKFWEIIKPFEQIKAIGFGHVHQAYEGEHQGIKLFASPSTSIQFKPQNTEFAVDDIASGYRWYKFFDDGTLETGVERLHYIPENLQTSSEGY